MKSPEHSTPWMTKAHCLPVLIYAVALAAIAGYLAGTLGCRRLAPVRIGYVGSLTGPEAEMSISGRNGVILAVEQINESGGINGRPVVLITKDDRQDESVAVAVDKELIKEGVVAIIGHMTSAMSLAVLPVINAEKILMISPASSTDALTGIDDYFFRVVNSHRSQTDRLADYAFKTMGMKRMASITDLSNPEYSGGFCHNFQAEFEYLGGEFIKTVQFNSTPDVLDSELAQKIITASPDGLLVVANGHDTALICQQLKKLGSRIPVISSSWAMTMDLFRYGGLAVEGVTFCSSYDQNNLSQGYVGFKQQFNKRFDGQPDFPALSAYEACRILFNAVEKAQHVSQLKAVVLQQGIFPGLIWDIAINRFGDAHLGQYLTQVIDGQFRAIDSWTPDTGKPRMRGIQ
jgi:branched-chain amino acid transport system substrate-binding protein